MQHGGYEETTQRYGLWMGCDGYNPAHPMGNYELPKRFYGESRAIAEKNAIQAGWQFFEDGRAYCPLCNGKEWQTQITRILMDPQPLLSPQQDFSYIFNIRLPLCDDWPLCDDRGHVIPFPPGDFLRLDAGKTADGRFEWIVITLTHPTPPPPPLRPEAPVCGPIGVIYFDHATKRQMMLVTEGEWEGWLCYRREDFWWISVRPATDVDKGVVARLSDPKAREINIIRAAFAALIVAEGKPLHVPFSAIHAVPPSFRITIESDGTGRWFRVEAASEGVSEEAT